MGSTFAAARALRKDRATISRWQHAGLRRQREDTALRERLHRLDAIISPLG